MRKRETEIKLPVRDLRALRRQLRRLGFRLAHARALEDNFLFDTPDRALRQVRSILRLRRYGSRWVVTYKGTPEKDRGYKSRLELETEVQHAEAIRTIFEVLGLKPVFRYQKYRSRYVQGENRKRGEPYEAALDETPIGAFLELEGSRAWIDRIARLLGYSRADYSTASYGSLYLEDCRKKKLPPGDMLFPPRPPRHSAAASASPAGVPAT